MTDYPKFFIQIETKPYVRHFLEMNFGCPVNFNCDPEAHEHAIKLLRKPDCSMDNKYPDIYSYTEFVEVVISEHDFYRYGWELTRTNTISFGVFFERRAKFMMRSIVGIYVALGFPVTTSIQKFQEHYGYNEDIWSYDTIKKDFTRNAEIEKFDFENELFKKIDTFILRNLSKKGTISQLVIPFYENDK